MLADPHGAAHAVDRSIDNEAKLTALLKTLPAVMRSIEDHDHLCASAWRDGQWETEPPDYSEYQDQLIAQFERLHIRSSAYERVVRQADKPLLREALELTRDGRDRDGDRDRDGTATAALENKLRMKLPQYLANEKAIAALLTSLDQARADVVQLHIYWAIDLAQSLNARDVAATQAAAARAVELAARSYDYRRGYPFREFAQQLVKEQVQRQMSQHPRQG